MYLDIINYYTSMSIFISISTINKLIIIYSTSTSHYHTVYSIHTLLHAYHMMTTIGGLSGIIVTVYMINMSIHSTEVIIYHCHCILSMSCVIVCILLMYCISCIQYMYCHVMLYVFILSLINTRRMYTVLLTITHLNLSLLWSVVIYDTILCSLSWIPVKLF